MIVASVPQANYGIPPVIATAAGSWAADKIMGAGSKAPIPPFPATWQPSAFDPNYNKTYRTDPAFQSLEQAYVSATGFPGFSMEEFLDARIAGHPQADTSRRYVWTRVQENIRDRNDPSGLAAAEALLDYFRPATGGLPYPISTAGFGGGSGLLPILAVGLGLLLLKGGKPPG